MSRARAPLSPQPHPAPASDIAACARSRSCSVTTPNTCPLGRSSSTTIIEFDSISQVTEEARINAAVAQLIYAARAKAGLSQAELAERIGTKQSVISRLEDADYEGHSLGMLHRIAAALGQCVEIRFLPPARAGRDRRPKTAILEPVG